MRTASRRGFVYLAITAALLGCGAGLGAQQPAPVSPDVAAEWRRAVPAPAANLLVRQPLVEEALRSYGYRPDRLTRAQERAIESTYTTLYPDTDPRRHRLNRLQATALVYMALVFPGGGGRADGGWRGGGCEIVARQVSELDNLFAPPGRGQPRYLLPNEQRDLRDAAQEIQVSARRCGDLDVADDARRLHTLASERRSEREQVERQVYRMKTAVRLGMLR